jgi:putative CocE/NonD family hydrolase
LGQKSKPKISQLGQYQGYTQKSHQTFRYQSQYIFMPDGVGLASDLYLPHKPFRKSSEKKFPCLVYFVRYGRSMQARFPFSLFTGKPFNSPHIPKKELKYFSQHGYACLVVDLRGSGASFGRRRMEFSPEEVADMAKVLDWIVAQPWSNGQTATTGVSYTGTTAELALSTQHPSLKACIARCNIFDLYADMNFPGGLRQSPFIEIWKKTTQALDQSRYQIFGPLSRLVVKSVRPVKRNRGALKTALAGHRDNFDIFAGLYRVEARDDIEPESGLSTDAYSIHQRRSEIEASGVPIYRISGWYDGANVLSAFKGFWNTRNTQKILIGPWDHGPKQDISPFRQEKKINFDLYAEMLRFMDYHLKGIPNGIADEDPIHYYRLGPECFQAAKTFPPSFVKNQIYYLDTAQIQSQKPGPDAWIRHYPDYQVGTGGGSRWNSLTPLFRYEKEIGYKNRAAMNARMWCFDSPVLSEGLELTGLPQLQVQLKAPSTDLALFAYLEDLAPDGRVTYITEGQLRALHRKLDAQPSYWQPQAQPSFKRADIQPLQPEQAAYFELSFLPISYALPPGHRLRLSLAFSDVDHFETPLPLAEWVDLHLGSARLSLPVVSQP